jgi:hypothetical protein
LYLERVRRYRKRKATTDGMTNLQLELEKQTKNRKTTNNSTYFIKSDEKIYH